MIPLARFKRVCDRQYAAGAIYPLDVHEGRSHQSHKHYFACIHDAWLNLPESWTDEFPTDEHLRKHALIKAGYCDKRSLVLNSRAEALRTAAFIQPIDSYAIVTAQECTVTVYTAQSQSVKAMGGKVFQESKTAVLDIVSAMAGVKLEELSANAGQAA